jgi:hypothetical protein
MNGKSSHHSPQQSRCLVNKQCWTDGQKSDNVHAGLGVFPPGALGFSAWPLVNISGGWEVWRTLY